MTTDDSYTGDVYIAVVGPETEFGVARDSIQNIRRRPGDSGLRVSFRSRGKIDVSRIATLFGGGGHHNAAGCRVQASLDEVRECIFAEVTRLLRPAASARPRNVGAGEASQARETEQAWQAHQVKAARRST